MNVTNFGSAMVDTIAVIHAEDIERMKLTNADSSYLLLREGSKTDAQAISTHTGGGAMNVAVSFKRLGANVTPVVKIGDDLRGAQVRETLEKEGIAQDFVLTHKSEPTGSSVHVAAHEKNAAIFTFRGANTTLSATDLQETHFKTDVVYISGLSNASAACFPVIVEKGFKAGAFVAVNPGLRQISSRLDEFKATLPKLSLLALNKLEAESLFDALDTHYKFTLPAFFAKMQELGVKNCLVTDGAKGAHLHTHKGNFYAETVKVKVAGTAGAGDAFISTLVFCLKSGLSEAQSLSFASQNAASVVSFVDTTTGLLSFDALHAKINNA